MNTSNIKTKLLSRLENRLSELRILMLPEKFDDTGDYDDTVREMTKAYIVLAHAEFEFHLEEICKEIIEYAIDKFSENPENLSPTLFSLFIEFKEQIANNSTVNNMKGAIKFAHTQYLHKIKNNHGIKRRDIKSLVSATGINFDILDTNWIANMDNFGVIRGNIAHTSATHVTTLYSPQEALDKVTKILDGIRDFDQNIIEQYKKIPKKLKISKEEQV